MLEIRTCGKGLAEHALIPAKIGELIDSLAENLDEHLTALDLTDNNSKKEHDVYRELVRAYNMIAVQLAKTAKWMAAHRDLAMGRHDREALQGIHAHDVFGKFVKTEEELLHLLEARVVRDRQLLSRMGKAVR